MCIRKLMAHNVEWLEKHLQTFSESKTAAFLLVDSLMPYIKKILVTIQLDML